MFFPGLLGTPEFSNVLFLQDNMQITNVLVAPNAPSFLKFHGYFKCEVSAVMPVSRILWSNANACAHCPPLLHVQLIVLKLITLAVMPASRIL